MTKTGGSLLLFEDKMISESELAKTLLGQARVKF
jgi:hypothetical protein